MEVNSTTSIVLEGWNNSDKADAIAGDVDDTDSECNSSSQSVPLSRYPSLAELSCIATNSDTTDLVSGDPYLQEQGITPAPCTTEDENQFTTPLNSLWSQSLPATPPKTANGAATSKNQTSDDPLTPTANLKMLVSAASPAIRDREIKKRELFPGRDVDTLESLQAAASLDLISNSGHSKSREEHKSDNAVDKITVSRKDKSLGLLCQK